MSIRQLNKAWDAECQSHTQKLVLLSLADNANDDGGCWPSITTIARRCNMSRQGIMNQIAAFETDGWLSVERTAGKVNHYTLTIPDQSTPLTSQRGGLVNTVDQNQSTGLTGPVNGVDTNHKEPSEEPPLESLFERGIRFAEWFVTLLPEGTKIDSAYRHKWATIYRQLIEIDKRTNADIVKVCKWARADSFWSSNFYTPAKLRKKNPDGVTYFDTFLNRTTHENQNNKNNPKRVAASTANSGTSNEKFAHLY